MKNKVIDLDENLKAIENISAVKRKLDNLAIAFEKLQKTHQSDESNAKENQKSLNEKVKSENKTVNTTIDKNYDQEINELKTKFGELEKKLNKNLEYEKENLSEIKRQLDDLIVSITHKISEREIKILEEYLLGRIEDQKINNVKKFADKMEIQKSVKNLDTQIKFIFELINKKERGDNWLLAKKPLSLSSYQCASCDNFIADIAVSNQNQQPSYKNPPKDFKESNKVYSFQ